MERARRARAKWTGDEVARDDHPVVAHGRGLAGTHVERSKERRTDEDTSFADHFPPVGVVHAEQVVVHPSVIRQDVVCSRVDNGKSARRFARRVQQPERTVLYRRGLLEDGRLDDGKLHLGEVLVGRACSLLQPQLCLQERFALHDESRVSEDREARRRLSSNAPVAGQSGTERRARAAGRG